MRKSILFGMLGAIFGAPGAGLVGEFEPKVSGPKGARSKYMPHQGVQEKARRLRQYRVCFDKRYPDGVPF